YEGRGGRETGPFSFWKLVFPRHYNQRQPPPRNRRIDPPPEPHRLIEQLQRRFIDPLPPQQLPIHPPTQRADLIDLVHALDTKAFLFEHPRKLLSRETPLVAQ